MILLRLVTWSALLVLVSAMYRWTWRRSRLLGYILAAGIAARLIIGGALFTISALDLPVLRGLHHDVRYVWADVRSVGFGV